MTVEFFDLQLPVWVVEAIISALETAYVETGDWDFKDALHTFKKALWVAQKIGLDVAVVRNLDDYTPEVVKKALHIAASVDKLRDYHKALERFVFELEHPRGDEYDAWEDI